MSELEPLQRLTFDSAPERAKTIGERGELAWLPLKHLFIDPAYQRAILKTGKANIKRMIEQFSWERFGACVVAKRGKDRFAIIDGQHRATAAFNLGLSDVPCLILKGGREAEARAFNAINANVTRIHALQSFRAAVAGGDKDALAVYRACAEAGVSIAPYPKPELKPGETQALLAIRQCLTRHGHAATVTALMVLRAADAEASLPGVAVKALCEIAPKHPEWNRDAAKIGGYLARAGNMAALLMKTAERKHLRGGAEWKNFAEIVEAAVASGQRTANIPKAAMAGR